ncbi:UNVERIFIED_CONTAM: hypothetical protein GTU68_042244 [Idotea baltica]|nr:hypothetical protein [Idotea baltica]
MLWEGMGFGWAETGYSGVTFPLVEPCLQRVTKLGFKRVIVFPYFLFTGILIDRIYGFTDEVAAQYPEIQFVKAGYLNDHPQVIATFAERVTEILGGENLMNCAMCKYRAQVLDAHDHAHSHAHEHGHDHHHHHDHVHASYPHADHPDGPESVRDRLKKT